LPEATLRFERVTAGALREDCERAGRLAELVWSAGHDFYELFGCNKLETLATIATQIGVPHFDLATALVGRTADGDAALVAGTTMDALSGAQMASMALHLKQVPPTDRAAAVSRFRSYSALLEPIDEGGIYVARVAVASQCQNTGFGKQIMREYLTRFGGGPVHLHVRRDNARAIALYRSVGFTYRSSRDFAFPALTHRGADLIGQSAFE
jgi:ribosomal protein S18 acetylase RimI-like enzyme